MQLDAELRLHRVERGRLHRLGRRHRGLEWAAHGREGLAVEPFHVAGAFQVHEALGRLVSDIAGMSRVAVGTGGRAGQSDSRRGEGSGAGSLAHGEELGG